MTTIAWLLAIAAALVVGFVVGALFGADRVLSKSDAQRAPEPGDIVVWRRGGFQHRGTFLGFVDGTLTTKWLVRTSGGEPEPVLDLEVVGIQRWTQP